IRRHATTIIKPSEIKSVAKHFDPRPNYCQYGIYNQRLKSFDEHFDPRPYCFKCALIINIYNVYLLSFDLKPSLFFRGDNKSSEVKSLAKKFDTRPDIFLYSGNKSSEVKYFAKNFDPRLNVFLHGDNKPSVVNS
ncbi:hypothetical protein CISIN_1g043320mg, partial [Citrus sinensis]